MSSIIISDNTGICSQASTYGFIPVVAQEPTRLEIATALIDAALPARLSIVTEIRKKFPSSAIIVFNADDHRDRTLLTQYGADRCLTEFSMLAISAQLRAIASFDARMNTVENRENGIKKHWERVHSRIEKAMEVKRAENRRLYERFCEKSAGQHQVHISIVNNNGVGDFGLWRAVSRLARATFRKLRP